MKKLFVAAAALAASFSVPAHAVVIATGGGTLEAGDSVQNSRIFRDGVASTWAAPKAFPGTFGGTFVYDLLNVSFAANAFQDVFYQITFTNLDSSISPFSTAYQNSFDAGNLATNYLGDIGSSPSAGGSGVFQVVAAAGNSLVLHFGEANNGVLPSDYSYQIEAFSDARGGENFISGAVPEPTTWAMMILGFGLVGGAMRRKGTVRSTTLHYA